MGKSQDALIANGILKAHNFPTYLELLKKYDDGEHMVGLTQATGTGKTYITAQFIYDECFNTIHFVKEFDHVPAKPKKVLILSPTANLSRQTARVLFNQLGPNLQHASMMMQQAYIFLQKSGLNYLKRTLMNTLMLPLSLTRLLISEVKLQY